VGLTSNKKHFGKKKSFSFIHFSFSYLFRGRLLSFTKQLGVTKKPASFERETAEKERKKKESSPASLGVLSFFSPNL